MKTLDNFHLQHKCLSCKLRKAGFFCELSPFILKAFQMIKRTYSHDKGTTLFVQGQPAIGLYMLCQGRVKLSICSKDGKAVILRIAEAGDILGLSAAIAGETSHATAVAIEQCQVNFVHKDDFLKLMKQYSEVSFNVARQLARNYNLAFEQIMSLALSTSSAERLATLLLGWSRTNGNGGPHAGLRMRYTHEEIGAMIGTSRETVTRLLNGFKRSNLISISGSDLYIHDVHRLELMTGSSAAVSGRSDS